MNKCKKYYFFSENVIKKNFVKKPILNAGFLKNKNILKSKTKHKKINLLLAIISGIFIGFINGFWGGGGGMLCVPILSSVFKLKEKFAHATAILIMMPLSIASVIVYALKNKLEWGNVGLISLGFVVGGVLGALILKKINNIFLRIVFSGIIIFCGIRILI